MCGIFGVIGESKNPKVTLDLLNNLFLKTEVRGTDASGFYALQPGNGGIILDKEPIKASEYVKRGTFWDKTFKENCNVNLFIGHCRQTSVGGGPEKINKNNHPHWSDDRKVAITHNGKIPEFSALKSRYDVESDCDSEILLRMFESAQIIAKDREEELKKEFPSLTPFLAERLVGLKEIFSRVNYGAMAVAIAERGDDGQRYLWLFRDEERPLHVVDMRETLGQVFYVSTPEIWRNVTEMTPSLKKENNPEKVDYLVNPSGKEQVIIEFPAYQIWLLNLDPSKNIANEAGDVGYGPESWNIKKFRITKTKYIDYKEGEDEDDKISFKKSNEQKSKTPVTSVVTRLGGSDVIVTPKAPDIPTAKEFEEPPIELPDDDFVLSGENDKPKKKGEQLGPVSARVIINRDPGDESEHDTEVLKNPTLVSASDSEDGGIDLEAFNTSVAEIEEFLKNLKNAVANAASDKSLPGASFSQILDNLEVIRQEAQNALAVAQG